MPYITVKDGTQIYYKDWGPQTAQPIAFSRGWPLSSDDWEMQMFFLANKGYRVIAHDRRGSGRSSQPWDGHDMDTNSVDLNALLEHLDLHNVMLVGHSTGGGEVARFLGRPGSQRVAKAVLIASVAPGLVKTISNPAGVELEFLDGFRRDMIKDRAQLFLEIPSSARFFGQGGKASQGMIWNWYRQGMMAGFKAAYECIKVFSETDTSEDIRGADVPILVLHGTDDPDVPIEATGRRVVELAKNATIKEFPGGPHALHTICADEVNHALLEFLQS